MDRLEKTSASKRRSLFMALCFVILIVIIARSQDRILATSTYYENWNPLTSETRSLTSGNYIVKDDVVINAADGESGLKIAGEVNIYIKEGKSLHLQGGKGNQIDVPSGAGLELPEGASLSLFGKGTLEATGGIGHRMEQSANATSLVFGAGAGIGGSGGIEESVESDKSIINTSLKKAQAMGNLYVYEQVKVIANAGLSQELSYPAANIGGGGGNEQSESKAQVYVSKQALMLNPPSNYKSTNAASMEAMKSLMLDQQNKEAEITLELVEGKEVPSIETIPWKEGYEFAGYYSGPNGEGSQYLNALGQTTNILWDSSGSKLYAHWIPLTYTLTLHTDGVDNIEVTGGTRKEDGTYQFQYGEQVSLKAVHNDQKTITWYENDTYLQQGEVYTYAFPAKDVNVTASTQKANGAKDGAMSQAQVNIQIFADNTLCDMGKVTLVADQEIIQVEGSKGEYHYKKDVDTKEYEVYVDGKKTGKKVSFQAGVNHVRIDFHRLRVYTTLDKKAYDAGVIDLVNTNDALDTTKLYYDAASGYAQYYGVEDATTTYRIKAAGEWSLQEIKFTKAQDVTIAMHQAVIKTSLDGISKNMGEVSLHKDDGELAYTMNRTNGIYEVIASDEGIYNIYVNGVDSEKTIRFGTSTTLSYYTLSYEIANPNVVGDVAKSAVYLEGTKIKIPEYTNLVRNGYRFIGWRNEHQIYVGGSELELHRTTQLFDAWESMSNSNQKERHFQVGELRFETLDEAILSTQLSNSSAFGEREIQYDGSGDKQEIYGILPNGYRLIGTSNEANTLFVPKGKSLTIGEKTIRKDVLQYAQVEQVSIVVNGGELNIDGQHAKFEASGIILMPNNKVNLTSDMLADTQLDLTLWEDEGSVADGATSKAWESDMELLSGRGFQTKQMAGNTHLTNTGFATYQNIVEGNSTLSLCNEKDITAMRQITKENVVSVYGYRSIQEAILEVTSDPKAENMIYIMQDSEEDLNLFGDENPRIRFVSGKRNENYVEADEVAKTLYGDIQIEDITHDNQIVGTIFEFDQIAIVNTIQIGANSSIEVVGKKWNEKEIITLQSKYNQKQPKVLVRGSAQDLRHFQLSRALQVQGYGITEKDGTLIMKYYGKPISLQQDLQDITSSEDETYTLSFQASYETEISDDRAISDQDYQEISYEWQRKRTDQKIWEVLESKNASAVFENGTVTINYRGIAQAQDRDYVYRCKISNKSSAQAGFERYTREASMVVSEDPSNFIQIPRKIQLRQEEATNRITLLSYKEEMPKQATYQVYTKPTFELRLIQQSTGNLLDTYDIDVIKSNGMKVGADETLMRLEKGKHEQEMFSLTTHMDEQKILGIYKGNMIFRIRNMNP